MKKLIYTATLVMIASVVFAKKVKFAVDMSNEVLSPNGIHVTGDFQTVAGFPGGDWASNTTTLTQEGSTAIYSIVVDIPAFTKYEYKFVNGDQFYEAEFVPAESRVGYNFNDNRWLYVDSLADDTTFIGALVFAANAPVGLTLVRTLVNMQNETVAASGIHLATDFQGWDPGATYMYSFGSNTYEVISYVNAGTINYRFVNGNTVSDYENVPTGCQVNGNRQLVVTADIVLTEVCFSSCAACLTGINDLAQINTISLSPNPAGAFLNITSLGNEALGNISISDLTGRTIKSLTSSDKTIRIETKEFARGMYNILVTDRNNNRSTLKIVIR